LLEYLESKISFRTNGAMLPPRIRISVLDIPVRAKHIRLSAASKSRYFVEPEPTAVQRDVCAKTRMNCMCYLEDQDDGG
jgi:hypothetical protein